MTMTETMMMAAITGHLQSTGETLISMGNSPLQRAQTIALSRSGGLGRTYLQYDFAIHLSQLEKVEGTDSISLAVLRTQYIAILAGLMMRVYRVF
jgi:hypothetical protein